MALEVEHKFLLSGDGWRPDADGGRVMRQGYLVTGGSLSVRIRTSGERAWLNIKHARTLTVRQEYEYEIPLADAREMLETVCAAPQVEKTRYEVKHHGHVWEIDVFHGANEGLVVAEVELAREGESFVRPDWLGEEVSHDARYLNQNLAVMPYSRWRGVD